MKTIAAVVALAALAWWLQRHIAISRRDEQIVLIKVPRAKQMAYAYLPWSQVVEAAERGNDGLEIRGPHFTPRREEAPRRTSYELADHSIDEKRYEKDLAKWEADRDVCFFREGKSAFDSDKTLLFQQNW